MKTRYDELKRRVYELGKLSLGSIQTRWLTCGNPDCKCAKGEKHGPYYYFAYTDMETGKTAQVFIHEDEVSELKERIKNYEKFKSELWELVKLEVRTRKRRGR